jgi:UPF0755 protein
VPVVIGYYNRHLKSGNIKKRDMAKLKKIIILLTTTALACIIVVAMVYLDLKRYANQPASAEKSREKIHIVVEPGYSFVKIAKLLEDKGLVVVPIKFRLIARIYRLDKRIKAGEYLLSPDMTPIQIIDIITKGRVYLHRIVIPEGFNLKQIAVAVEQAEFADADSFLKVTGDPDLPARLNISSDSLEGYLFPDTYLFAKGTTIIKIIETMVSHFNSQFKPEWKKQARKLGFSVHEIVTLASIIEKETGNPSERKTISSVFHNRLKKKMRLETDPTVIYGIKDYNGNITRLHLKTWTPYNTYMIKGLPPGPIASPGAASLEAALYPDKTDYLFFVSKKDTTHHFSRTIREHNRAVRKYQLRPKR